MASESTFYFMGSQEIDLEEKVAVFLV